VHSLLAKEENIIKEYDYIEAEYPTVRDDMGRD